MPISSRYPPAILPAVIVSECRDPSQHLANLLSPSFSSPAAQSRVEVRKQCRDHGVPLIRSALSFLFPYHRDPSTSRPNLNRFSWTDWLQISLDPTSSDILAISIIIINGLPSRSVSFTHVPITHPPSDLPQGDLDLHSLLAQAPHVICPHFVSYIFPIMNNNNCTGRGSIWRFFSIPLKGFHLKACWAVTSNFPRKARDHPIQKK